MNPHQSPPSSIGELFASLWRNRMLVLQLTQREVIGRYRGSVIGLAWSLFNPLLMLAVYTFMFSVVFKARWGVSAGETQSTFAILVFTGIIIHGMFAECVNKAPTLILNNVNYVKKVVFPLEVLPWIAMGSTLFHAVVSLIILVIAQLVLNRSVAWTVVFVPIIIFPFILLTMGAAWFLSALGVYIRDLRHTVGIFTTVLLFLSPVFYPLSAVPSKLQAWVAMNPLTFPLEESRKALILGHTPNGPAWALYMLAAITVAWMGFWWFQKSRKGFADVL